MRAFLGIVFGVSSMAVLAGAAGLFWALGYYGGDLPDYGSLVDYQPPTVTRIHAADGRLMAEYASERRMFVPISAIPKRISQAFLAAEDKSFYAHPGLDVSGIIRATLTNVKNLASDRRPVGASTITQQVAKNFLLGNEVSMTRKVKEAILAIRIEQTLSKDRILELYLNEIFLGNRSYGVAAAALNYFNKALDDITPAEAAYLAALPKAPNNYHPERNHDAALARRNWVIGRMQEDGYITAEEAEAAVQEPLAMRRRDDTEMVSADYFAEEVRRELVRMYEQTRVLKESPYEGGMSVRATLDPRLQQVATQVLREGLMDYDRKQGWRGAVTRLDGIADWQTKLAQVALPAGGDGWRLAVVLASSGAAAEIGFGDGTKGRIPTNELRWARRLNGAHRPSTAGRLNALGVGDVVMVEPLAKGEAGRDFALRQIPEIQGGLVALDVHTGRVLAMAGGFSPKASVFNRATQAMRQPGSAFKPFVYLTALENGFTPSSLVMDAPFAFDPGGGQPVWRPQNYSHEFYGPTPLRVGIEKSRNVMTVRLAHHLGMDKIKATAERFGIFDKMEPYLPMSLGAGETTVLRMVTAYAMIANGGKRIVPSIIDRIQDREGRTVYRHDTRPCQACRSVAWAPGTGVPAVPDTREKVTEAAAAYQMVLMLKGVTERGTAAALKALGRPLAGKTGTTNDSKDAWFIGFNPDLAVGLYIGYDQPRPLGRGETGGSLAVPVFQDFMAAALKETKPKPFPQPPGVWMVRVDPRSGRLADPGEAGAILDAFLPGTEPEGERLVLDGSSETGLDWTKAGGNGDPGEGATGTPAATSLGTGGLY